MKNTRTLEEMFESDRKRAEEYRKQQRCPHAECYPTTWHWSGKPAEMHCPECGLTEFREDES